MRLTPTASPPAAPIGLLFALFLGACTDAGGAGRATYRSDEYGFQFSYPDSLDLLEYTPAIIALGHRQGDGFDAVVENVLELADEGTFEEYAVDRARTSCAADGPDLSLSCTDVLDPQPFAATSGREGIVFRLRHLTTRPGGTPVLETGTRGPFYALDASDMVDSPVAVLLVRPPAVLEPEEVDEQLLGEVAASVDF